MNKTFAYIGIAILVGLGLGYLFFGNSENGEGDHDASHQASHSAETLWTCSMHPQILREESGDCPICGMDLIKAESQGAGLAANQFRMTDNALALANIQTSVVGGTDVKGSRTLQLSGEIAVNEDATATQPAHFDGRIESLAITSLGQKVSKGQKVATAYSPALVAAQQELITTFKLKESQPQLYQAVRNKFKNWMIPNALLDQVERTGEVKTRFPIYAHVSGVVTEISVNEGAHIMDGMPIFKVSDLDEVWAEFDAYERQLNQIEVGQEFNMTVNALPNKSFIGTVSFIDPILDGSSRTVSVRAILSNPNGILKPGMFVTANIDGTPMEGGNLLTVPASAVMWTGERSLVYVKSNTGQPVFDMREVTLGQKLGDVYEVSEGLTAGEEIVTHGTFTVDAAAQLSGKASMMNGQSRSADNSKRSEDLVLPEDFQLKLKEALPGYLDLKDAFYNSEAEKVSAEAKKLKQQWENIEEFDLEAGVKTRFLQVIRQLNILETTTNLKRQREVFVLLNENLVPLVETLSIIDTTIYKQRCPMANNSQGAVWLSRDIKIENPYYGDEMPNCGSVVDTLPKANGSK
ncbi:MAG: efflux RND transporter periplasmic adaptor subunit [Leeuwenhoekiella sp.]